MRCLLFTMTLGLVASCDLDPSFLNAFKDQPVVSSAGTVRLTPEANAPIDAVHVRVSITNVAADASTAELVAPGHTPIHPFAIRGDIATLPFVRLDAHQRGELDFFFPIGIDPTNASFEWAGMRNTLAAHVDLDDRAETTWWFAENRFWSTFNHEDGVITTRPPTNATIVRASEIDRAPATEECDEW